MQTGDMVKIGNNLAFKFCYGPVVGRVGIIQGRNMSGDAWIVQFKHKELPGHFERWYIQDVDCLPNGVTNKEVKHILRGAT